VQGCVSGEVRGDHVRPRRVQQDVSELVGEGLHLGGVVHVHANRDLAGEEVGQPVGAADRSRGRDEPKLEPERIDLIGETVPEARRRLAVQQVRGEVARARGRQPSERRPRRRRA
jgi:hypothetical protein